MHTPSPAPSATRAGERAPPAAIEVILFDVGGVLVEISGIAAILDWLDHRITADEVWHLWLGSPAVRAFESGQIAPEAFATAMLAELGLAMPPRVFLDAFITWPARLYPGTLELLGRIPEHYRRALLSNTNALHWPRVMEELGLGAVFEHRFASHLIGKLKPDAEAFQHAADALACEPARILFLDDNSVNVDAARAVGMRAARVRGVIEAQRALEAAGIIESGARA